MHSGGSFRAPSTCARPSDRGNAAPDTREGFLGLRAMRRADPRLAMPRETTSARRLPASGPRRSYADASAFRRGLPTTMTWNPSNDSPGMAHSRASSLRRKRVTSVLNGIHLSKPTWSGNPAKT